MPKYIQYPLILFIVTVICVGAITVVESITAPIIEEREIETVNNLLNSTYPDMVDYQELDYQGTSTNIEAIYQVNLSDGSVNYAYKVQANGKEGVLKLLVSFDQNGVINHLSYITMNETPGIGDQVASPEYIDTIVGQNASSVKVDTVSGATISSTAVSTAVEAAASDFLTEKSAGFKEVGNA